MSNTIASRIAAVVGDNIGLLNDTALETLLRDTIAEAQRRSTMQSARRQLLAGALGEEKAEMLINTDMTPEQISAATDPTTVLAFPGKEAAL